MLTVEQILDGCGFGRMQAVGQMAVVPILRDGDEDNTFAGPDEVDVSTSSYGDVHLHNRSSRPTIVPPGAGWVTAERAQDHAIGSGAIVKSNENRHVDTARCIEASQGGYIRKAAHEMLVLPVALRSKALSMRKQRGYDMLWSDISAFNSSLGVSDGSGHLVNFLKHFEKELDEFVAEFELVPNQTGAIVMVGNHVVGIEVAPNAAFWETLWTPLIRVCYGSLAIKAGLKGGVPAWRQPLAVGRAKSLSDVAAALREATAKAKTLVTETAEALAPKKLATSGAPDDKLGESKLLTVANSEFAGQVVTGTGGRPVYASLCAAGA